MLGAVSDYADHAFRVSTYRPHRLTVSCFVIGQARPVMENKMSHPIRWQYAGPVRFYRMGTTLIAEEGDKSFVIQKYSDGSGFEASMRARSGLKMPIQGQVFPTRRAAGKYLLPLYLKELNHAFRVDTYRS